MYVSSVLGSHSYTAGSVMCVSMEQHSDITNDENEHSLSLYEYRLSQTYSQ